MSEKKNKWKKRFIELGNSHKGFTVIHNIPDGDIDGIEGAIENWMVRTNDLSESSFIAYIKSKGVHEAMSIKDWNQRELWKR